MVYAFLFLLTIGRLIYEAWLKFRADQYARYMMELDYKIRNQEYLNFSDNDNFERRS